MCRPILYMIVVPPPRANISRRTFLLTYSQADLSKYPDCQSFVSVILEALEKCKSSSTVKEWACCQELHADRGSHYHMSINLSAPRRWNTIKNYIYNRHNFWVNFATQSGCGSRLIVMLPKIKCWKMYYTVTDTLTCKA